MDWTNLNTASKWSSLHITSKANSTWSILKYVYFSFYPFHSPSPSIHLFRPLFRALFLSLSITMNPSLASIPITSISSALSAESAISKFKWKLFYMIWLRLQVTVGRCIFIAVRVGVTNAFSRIWWILVCWKNNGVYCASQSYAHTHTYTPY